jgi:sulfite reductase (NADPH) flavoprotein alpha-component
MSTVVPLIPDTAPFSTEQRAWLNGFFAGLFSRTAVPQSSPLNPQPSAPQSLVPVTILFGSQTGSAEGLAKRAAKEAGKRGFAATVLDMAQTDLAKLAAERNLLVITSTYGDGEPPDNGKALHTALGAAAVCHSLNDKRPLATVRFSICALGDTTYAQYCKARRRRRRQCTRCRMSEIVCAASLPSRVDIHERKARMRFVVERST